MGRLASAPRNEPGGGRRALIGGREHVWEGFQSVLTLAAERATHDSNRAASQTVDVVPDGTREMDGVVASQQSLQSWSVEPAEECTVSDLLSATPLAGSSEVLQMFRLGMHDVEMGGPGRENGVLRVGRQSLAELVFRLISPAVAARSRGTRNPRRDGALGHPSPPKGS